MSKQYLGASIRLHRKALKLTQSDLAAKLDMARTTIVAIEQDKRPLKEEEVTAFESVLGVASGTLAIPPEAPIMTGIHVYYGYRTGKREKSEKCWYCGDKPPQVYYTYFGAPLCAHCWDTEWRLTEDGEYDPPSEEINNRNSGVWL